MAILGLALVGYSGTELWDALWMEFDYTGIGAAVIRFAGFDYAGPISIVAVAFFRRSTICNWLHHHDSNTAKEAS